MEKKLLMAVLVVIIFLSAYALYTNSSHPAAYEGLSTVPCFDTTLPVKQNYSFTLHILIDGKAYPLSNTIGHDFGKCLHVLYTNDASGTIFVKANDMNTYTLGQLFDEWHKTFTPSQLMQYQGNTQVQINGKAVHSGRNTPLSSHTTITVIYE